MCGDEVILETVNLSCGYGKKDVVRGVSLMLRRGEIAGLAGKNGAGKTTLLRAILGHLKPSAGSVKVRGEPMEGLPAAKIARIVALAPQLLEVPFSFAVRDFVALGRLPHVGRLSSPGEKDLAAVENAISRTDLAHLADRRLDTLSGGERQRAVLAQALAQAPEILLLDEPASHLDIGHQVEVFEILAEVAATGTAVLVVLHDLNLAAEHCHRIVLMLDGAVFADGAPAEIISAERIEAAFGLRLAIEGGETPFVRYRRDASIL